MRGRKPKPTEQRRLEGNPGHRPLNVNEPTGPPLDDDWDTPPPELQVFPLAQEQWTRVAPLLRKSRHVGASDRIALTMLCLEYSIYLDMLRRIEHMVTRSAQGHPMINPYRSIAKQAAALCCKLLPELGLTPSSRSRVQTTGEPPADDPFAEFDSPPPSFLQ